MAFDSYALFLVFFLLGRVLSSHVEFLARWVRSKPQLAVAFVGFWFATNLFFLKIDLVERSGGLLVAGDCWRGRAARMCRPDR